MAKRRTRGRGRNGRESEMGKGGKMKLEQWPQRFCHTGEKRRRRLSDKTTHIKTVGRNKSGVAAYPGAAERLP